MGNIAALKATLERDIVSHVERIEIDEYNQNSGYNEEATVKFYIEDEFIADIKGGENIGWTCGDIYGDYFEEVTDTLRVRHSNSVVQLHSRPDGDNGIDGFDPLAHMSMEFTVQSAIDNLKSINNKKVDLPIAVLEMFKKSLTKGDR